MTWTISIIFMHLVLGSGLWLYFHRRRTRQGWRQAGIVEIEGRVCGFCGEEGVLWSDKTLPRRPVVIEVCSVGQRRAVLFEDPRVDPGWGRAEVRVGDPVKLEAVWVRRGPQPPSYRESAGEMTLEAMSVQLSRGVLRKQLTMATAGGLLLGLGLVLLPMLAPPKDKLAAIIDEVQCPSESKLQRVNLQLQGRLGVCLQRKSGLRHGPWLHLSLRGVKLVEGYYEYGKKHRHWTVRSESGRVKLVEGYYEYGKKHRLWTVRSESGRSLAQGRYQHDQQVGRWRYWDRSGLEIRSAKFVQGWPEPDPTSWL